MWHHFETAVGSTYTRVLFLDMLLLSQVECGMKRKLHYYFITSLLLVYMQYTNMLKLLHSIGLGLKSIFIMQPVTVNRRLCIDNPGIVL